MLADIKKITNRFYFFYKGRLAEIVLLVFVLQLLIQVRKLPYVNLIENYRYFVFIVLWIFVNYLFKPKILISQTIKAGLLLLLLAVPLVIVRAESLSEDLGFVTFILLLTTVLRKIYYLSHKEL